MKFLGENNMLETVLGVLRRPRNRAVGDGLAWLIAVPVSYILRKSGEFAAADLVTPLLVGTVCAGTQVLFGYATHLYRGRYRFATFDELKGVIVVVVITTMWPFYVSLSSNGLLLPRSVPFIAAPVALSIVLSVRFAIRALAEHDRASRKGPRTIIYGAGNVGVRLARQMIYDDATQYLPAAFIDDNPDKRHQRVAGIAVQGTIADLERIAHSVDAAILVVAIAGVDAATLNDLVTRCRVLGMQLRVIPSTSELMAGGVTLGDVSKVTEEDLLGRRPIRTDEESISGFLKGKRVLVTGAGGSIGSEISRQLRRYQPEYVAMLDRDETLLQNLQLSIDGRGLMVTNDLILADIRDSTRMHEVMQLVRPDIVFHAAALKHLPMLEMYPTEALKTNVQGTQNVLDAASSANVPVFVNISTDKAAHPTSVLGRTKRETEIRTSQARPLSAMVEPRYMSVRFGNVLGSRGSVLGTFRYQIQHGGPITLTDEDATRYFMTIPEAVHLVLEAASIGDHGETLVLDMGEPVRIYDVAKRLIEQSGRDIEIVVTGLRGGEKLEEHLVQTDEIVHRNKHPKIMHVRHTSVAPAVGVPEGLQHL